MKIRQGLLALFTVTLATTAALGLCEMSMRLFHLGPETYAVADGMFQLSSDPQLGYELLPGARDGDASISSKGLRDNEYTETKQTNTFRIAIIGDSVAFGYQVRQRETMPKVLERILNESDSGRAGIHYEVLNFGVEGYSSKQIARRMITTVSRFNPNVVVYLYCLNDPDQGWDDIMERLLAKLNPAEQGLVEHHLRHAHSRFSRLRLYSLTVAALSSLKLFRAHGVQFASWISFKPWSGSSERTFAYHAALHENKVKWINTVRDIERMASEAHSIGARFVGVISPIFQGNGELYGKNYRLGSVHAQVAEAFRLVGAHVLDLGPDLAKLPELAQKPPGRDIWHYSVEGHRRVAAILLDFLLKERLMPAERGVAGRVLLINEPSYGP